MLLSDHSHCALVLNDQEGQLYCFESTGNATDILERGVLPQVQIHLWQEAVTNYSGGVVLRKMVFDEGKEPNSATVSARVNELLGTEYENSLAVLIESIKGQNLAETPESLFCSELVAKILIELGYLPGTRLADNYLPRHFCAKEDLNLQHARLANEVTQKEKKVVVCYFNAQSQHTFLGSLPKKVCSFHANF